MHDGIQMATKCRASEFRSFAASEEGPRTLGLGVAGRFFSYTLNHGPWECVKKLILISIFIFILF